MTELTSVQWLRQIADEFDKFARCGIERDSPEGVRIVKVSETLMSKMIAKFREIATEIERPTNDTKT